MSGDIQEPTSNADRTKTFETVSQPDEGCPIEERYQRLPGGLEDWRHDHRTAREDRANMVYRHGSIFASMVFSSLGPGTWSTPQALRPGRMAEDILIKRSVLLDLLLAYTRITRYLVC